MALAFIVAFVRNKKGDSVPESTVRPSKSGLANVVSGVMDPNPLVIPFDASMAYAARMLASRGASGAVIAESDGLVRGYISNSDILKFFGDEMQTVTGASGFMALRQLDNEDVLDRASRLGGIKAIEAATRKVVGISMDASCEEACRMLAEKRLKELPVIEDGRIKGVVRRRDLMVLIAGLLEEE